MRILYLMTARGGSKGVPRKNLREIEGLSLIGWKARAAAKARDCTRIVISTDSEEIRAEAMRHGVEAPFLRPPELASDEASSADVVHHAVTWLETNEGERYDAIMLLEPTAPFTRPEHYDGAVDLMRRTGATLVVGMRAVEPASTFVGPMDAEGRITQIVDKIQHLRSLRRQDAPKEFTMNAGLYLFTWEAFRETRQLYVDRERSYGFVMDEQHSVEIDRPIDLAWAEFVVAQRLIDTSPWLPT